MASVALFRADGTSVACTVVDRATTPPVTRAERARLHLQQLAQPAARLVGASCPSHLLLLLSEACPLHGASPPVPLQFGADGALLQRGDTEGGLERLGGALQGLRALVVPLSSRSPAPPAPCAQARLGAATRCESVRILAAHLTALASSPCEAAVALEEAGEGRGDAPFRLRQTRLVAGHWRPEGGRGPEGVPAPAPGFIAVPPPPHPVMEGGGEGGPSPPLTPTLWEALGAAGQGWVREEERRREEARGALRDAQPALAAARAGLAAAVAAVSAVPPPPDPAEALRAALLAHASALVPVRRAAGRAARAAAALAPAEGLPAAYVATVAEAGRRRAWEGAVWERAEGGRSAVRAAEEVEEGVRRAWGERGGHLPSLSLLPAHVQAALGLDAPTPRLTYSVGGGEGPPPTAAPAPPAPASGGGAGAAPSSPLRALAAALAPAPCCEGGPSSTSSSSSRARREGRPPCDCALADNAHGVLWAAVDALRGGAPRVPPPEGEVALPPRVHQALAALLRAVDDRRGPAKAP